LTAPSSHTAVVSTILGWWVSHWCEGHRTGDVAGKCVASQGGTGTP